MPDSALVDQYQGLLLDLLPRGSALTRFLSGQIAKSCRGFAVELARVHEKLDDLYSEMYPGTAVETLEEWESLVGLPDACEHSTDTALRQQSVVFRMGENSGQSLLDFQNLATDRGYPPVTMGKYRTFRTGVHPIGHKPIYSDEWLFGSRIAYEVANPVDTEADTSLECAILRHAHIHTQMNFNPWDGKTPVRAMSNLFHWFACGEYVTHDDGSGNDVIDEWTNREPYDHFVQFGADSLTSRAVIDEDGWNACRLYDLGNKRLGGIYIGDTHSTSNMLRHNDYTFWLAFRVDLDYSGAVQHILDSGDWDLYINGGNITLDYDGSAQNVGAADIGPVNVLCVTHTGTDRRMQLNGGTVDLDTTFGTGSGATELILGASQFWGTALEIIGCNYEGPPGSTAQVDAVTNYLLAKYR